MPRYRTILDRLKKGRHYPTSQEEGFTKKFVVGNIKTEWGGNSDGKVSFRYADILEACVGSLHDPNVIGRHEHPYVTKACPR